MRVSLDGDQGSEKRRSRKRTVGKGRENVHGVLSEGAEASILTADLGLDWGIPRIPD